MADAATKALARRAVSETLVDLLVDLNEEAEDLDDDELGQVEEALDELASLVLEALRFEVVDVDSKGVITATLHPPAPAA
jgi:hypothetical protein